MDFVDVATAIFPYLHTAYILSRVRSAEIIVHHNIARPPPTSTTHSLASSIALKTFNLLARIYPIGAIPVPDAGQHKADACPPHRRTFPTPAPATSLPALIRSSRPNEPVRKGDLLPAAG